MQDLVSELNLKTRPPTPPPNPLLFLCLSRVLEAGETFQSDRLRDLNNNNSNKKEEEFMWCNVLTILF